MLGKAPDSILRAGALGTMVNASTYGRTIPLIYGTTRSPILAIWAANLRQRSGSGKKPWTKNNAPLYAENIDLLIGHNPLLAPLQVWDNANNFYFLDARVQSTTPSAGIVTISDPAFYAVLGVTITLPYNVTFNDFGGPGPEHLVGVYDQPLWNAAFNGPDPCNTSAYSIWWPYVYRWMPGTNIVQVPYLGNLFIGGAVHVYYAAADANVAKLARQNGLTGSETPISVLNLEWETLLGQGDEYALAGLPQQQIIYPSFAGVMSPNIDLGASGAIPNINIEMLGSFALYPDPTLTTMGGDADYADMITDIFTSGPAQGGYVSALQSAGALALTAVQHGLNCNNFPGIVQRHLWESSNFESAPIDIPFDAQVTEGSFLVVAFRNDTAPTAPTGISDTMGNVWTEIMASNPGSSSNNVYAWTCQAVTTGPTAVTIEFPAISGYPGYHQQLEMFEFAGFDTIDEVATDSAGSGVPTLTISSTTQRTRQGMMFAWWNFFQPGYPDLTKSAPRWQLATGLGVNDSTPEYGVISEFRKVYAPTTVTVSHPATYTAWAGFAISFKSSAVPKYPVSLGNILDWDTMQNARLGARAAGLYGSININSARKASDILTDLYASMNAAPVYSGSKLKSISWSEVSAVGNGAEFTAPTSAGPVADLGPKDFIGDASTPPGEVGRVAQVDRPPILSMQVIDRANNYNQNLISMPDAAGVSLFGARKASPIKRDEIQSPVVAQKLLGIASRRQVYIRNTYKYKLNMNWVLLEPMDLVTISDPQIGLDNFPVRVVSITQDDKNALDVEFEPFVYGVHGSVPIIEPVVEQSGAANTLDSTTNTFTFPLPVSPGDSILVAVMTSSETIVSVTDNLGNVYSHINSVSGGEPLTLHAGDMYLASDVVGGPLTITVTTTFGAWPTHFCDIAAFELFGVAYATGLAGFGAVDGASGVPYFGPGLKVFNTGTINTANASDFVFSIAMFTTDVPQDYEVPTGYTKGPSNTFLAPSPSRFSLETAFLQVARAGSYSPTWVQGFPSYLQTGLHAIGMSVGLMTGTPVVTPSSPSVTAFGTDPGDVNAPIFIEAVPQLALAKNTEELVIAVSNPGLNYGGCFVYLSTDGGASYERLGSLQASAITGTTIGDWPAHADPDTVNNLTVDLGESNGELASYTAQQRDSFFSLFYVEHGTTNIPYEIGAYNDAELSSTTAYTIFATGAGNEIRRSVFAAPTSGLGVDHPDGSRFAFLGNPMNGLGPGVFTIPIQSAWVGVALKFKFQSFNQFGSAAQLLADCTPYTFTPTGKPGQLNPSGIPPQVFTVNGT